MTAHIGTENYGRDIVRIKNRGISYDLIIKDNLVVLDSSFEDNHRYTKELLHKLTQQYSQEYQRSCIFNTMNQKISDEKSIFYKNYTWQLYKNIDPPMYKKNKYNFTYLCGFPREDKLHMLSRLFQENLLQDTLWSCGSIQSHNRMPLNYNLKLPDLPKIIDYDKSIKGSAKCWAEIDEDFYKYSRFSLVQETEMSNRSNRYTEKTYKCFWMRHPFILAGNYQTLKLLQQDGFKTFHPYIDESYDNIKNRDQRISAIIKEVKILCNKTKKEWKEYMININKILNHNYQHATSRKSS